MAAYCQQQQFQQQNISNSGDTITITNNLSATVGSFGYRINGSPQPTTISLIIQGCTGAAVCTTLDTYTTVANTTRTPAIGTTYSYFTVQGTWTGGGTTTPVSVQVSSTLTGASSSGGGGQSTTPTTTFPAAVTSLVAIGDSITLGFGNPVPAPVTNPSQSSFAQLFAAMRALPLTSNLAVSGAGLTGTGYTTQAHGLTPTAAVGTIGLFGANDITFAVGSAGNTTVFQNGMQEIVSWLALPAAAKVLDAGITYTGTWTSFTQFGLSGHFSNTINDTAQATVNGTSIYIGGWASGGYGNMDITIDGALNSNFVLAPAGNTMGAAVYPYCARVNGLSAGNHTVKITVKAAAFVTVYWMGGNGNVTKPLVAVGNTIPRTGFTSGNITTMNTAISAVTTGLAADGLNVALVNDSPVVSLTSVPATYNADNVHPNSYGQWLIAQSFFDTFTPPTTFPAASGVGGDYMAQVLKASGITASAIGSSMQSLASFLSQKDVRFGWASIDTNGALTSTALNRLTSYGLETVTGGGLSAIRGLTSQKNETGADASVLSVTPAAAVGTYRLNVTISVSAANTATLGWTATWTDSNGTAQTPTNLSLFQSGTAAPALTFTTSAAGNYYGSAIVDINNAGTAIVIKTTFSGTTIAYKVTASVERMN
jgi:lysophospholipase L1-like esterase